MVGVWECWIGVSFSLSHIQHGRQLRARQQSGELLRTFRYPRKFISSAGQSWYISQQQWNCELCVFIFDWWLKQNAIAAIASQLNSHSTLSDGHYGTDHLQFGLFVCISVKSGQRPTMWEQSNTLSLNENMKNCNIHNLMTLFVVFVQVPWTLYLKFEK